MIEHEEKKKLRNNYGRRNALGKSIAETFGIEIKNIEVGSSMISKYGIMTHIVHYIYEEDLDMMEEELQDQINFLSPKYFISQLFVSLKEDVNNVFSNHFDLNNDFEISLDLKLGIKQRTKRTLVASKSPSMIPESTPKMYARRDTVLQSVMGQISNSIAESDGAWRGGFNQSIDRNGPIQRKEDHDEKKRWSIDAIKSTNGMRSLVFETIDEIDNESKASDSDGMSEVSNLPCIVQKPKQPILSLEIADLVMLTTE